MAQTKIYICKNLKTGEEELYRALSASKTFAHVSKSTFEVKLASQEVLERLLPTGVKVQEISEQSSAA